MGNAKYYQNNKDKVKLSVKKYAENNRQKYLEFNREYYLKNADKQRDRIRFLKYGISGERYKEIFASQKGLCAICNNPERVIVRRTGEILPLSVDHNHECCPGKKSCGRCIRQLICSDCNRGLGNFKDSLSNLEKAIEYLRRNNGTNTTTS